MANTSVCVRDADSMFVNRLEDFVDTDFLIGDLQLAARTSLPPSRAPSEASEASEISSVCDSELAYPKIVACGKGMALYMPKVFKKVISLTGKKRPNIVYIGTASFDNDDSFNRHAKKFLSRGCLVDRINVSEPETSPSHDEMRWLVVEWADLLVCSGGNTLHALLRWKETGLDLLIKEAAEKDTVLCGGSAGAGCWFSSMHSDSLRPDNAKNAVEVRNELDEEELNDWDYVKISGLGIIPSVHNIMAVPHFDKTGTNGDSRSDHALETMTGESDMPAAIGIDNNAALIVEGDKISVVSGDGEATCHVMIKDELTHEISSSPLDQRDKPMNIDELIGLANPEPEHLETLDEDGPTDFSD
jgi:dipeptidase E